MARRSRHNGVVSRQVVVELDVTHAPWTAQWAERAARMCRQWHPLISRLLDTPGFHPLSAVTLRMVPTIGGASGRIGTPGVTSGQVIMVGADWVDEHPDDTGLVLHELVHVVQSYPSGEPWWVTEGIADWVRYQRVETDHPAATPDIRGRSYTDGYAVTAAVGGDSR